MRVRLAPRAAEPRETVGSDASAVRYELGVQRSVLHLERRPAVPDIPPKRLPTGCAAEFVRPLALSLCRLPAVPPFIYPPANVQKWAAELP